MSDRSEVFVLDVNLFISSLPSFVAALDVYFVAPRNPLKLALVSEPGSSSLILKFLSLKDFL